MHQNLLRPLRLQVQQILIYWVRSDLGIFMFDKQRRAVLEIQNVQSVNVVTVYAPPSDSPTPTPYHSKLKVLRETMPNY